MCISKVVVVSEKCYFPPRGCATPSDVAIKVVTMSNGEKHVPFSEYDKLAPCIHLTNKGDSKTGEHVQSLSTPIAHTCDQSFSCWCDENGKAICYGCTGEFVHYPNQAIMYAETLKAYIEWDIKKIASEIEKQVKRTTPFVRFSVIGDLTPKSFRAMILVAEKFLAKGSNVIFYTYTKKYKLVNTYVERHGNSKDVAIPSNFSVLFSEWNGREVDNPYGFRLSRFVPFEKKDSVTLEDNALICPCSFPEWGGTCEECGQCPRGNGNIYLVEHSTKASAKHDKETHARQKALKDEKKALKKDIKEAKKQGNGALEKAITAWEKWKAEHIDRFLVRA